MTADAEAIAASLEAPTEFVVVFDRHFRAVYRFLALRCGVDAAADMAAETFARAFERRAGYRPQAASALPWLLGIATRVAANERRREARRQRAYARVDPLEPTQLDGHAVNGTGPAREALVAALEDLKPRDRDALLLFAWGELDYSEIAEALEIPVGTVRSRLNRARRQLQAALGAAARMGELTRHGGEGHA